jgi:hypothetical protein
MSTNFVYVKFSPDLSVIHTEECHPDWVNIDIVLPCHFIEMHYWQIGSAISLAVLYVGYLPP